MNKLQAEEVIRLNLEQRKIVSEQIRIIQALEVVSWEQVNSLLMEYVAENGIN